MIPKKTFLLNKKINKKRCNLRRVKKKFDNWQGVDILELITDFRE